MPVTLIVEKPPWGKPVRYIYIYGDLKANATMRN
jgi:hypothetical protein